MLNFEIFLTLNENYTFKKCSSNFHTKRCQKTLINIQVSEYLTLFSEILQVTSTVCHRDSLSLM